MNTITTVQQMQHWSDAARAARPAHRLRADDGLPARRPPEPGRARRGGAPTSSWRPSSSTRCSSAPTKTWIATRVTSSATRDCSTDAGTDVLFLPDAKEMYPEGFQTTVTVERVTRGLCGASRPTHFRGVTTVVAKLFNMVKPHVAVFGQKDFQQLVAIRRMVADLNFDIEIVGAPIVREADGLAMSSRNAYLSAAERHAALLPVAGVARPQRRRSSAAKPTRLRILGAARRVITDEPLARLDYATLVDPDTLEDVTTVRAPGAAGARRAHRQDPAHRQLHSDKRSSKRAQP